MYSLLKLYDIISRKKILPLFNQQQSTLVYNSIHKPLPAKKWQAKYYDSSILLLLIFLPGILVLTIAHTLVFQLVLYN